MTVKITAHYQLEDREKTVIFYCDNSVSKSEIENEVEEDFWDWLQQYDYGWRIISIEKTER